MPGTIRPISYFTTQFQIGHKITKEEYDDWLVSFRHINDPVPLSNTTGLEAVLANYRRLDTQVPLADVAGLAIYIAQQLSGYLPVNGTIQMSQVSGLAEALANLGMRIPALRVTAAADGNSVSHLLLKDRQVTLLVTYDIVKDTGFATSGTTLTINDGSMTFKTGQKVTLVLD